jgi:FtsP/CotA-like multicopper oxidase with cupredoxin domain
VKRLLKVVRIGITAGLSFTLLAAAATFAGTPLVAKPPPLTPDPVTGAYVLPLLPATQVGQMFKFELPQPIFYTPDTTTFPGFDYYEIDMSPVEHVSLPGTPLAGVFPTPLAGQAPPKAGEQWLGLADPVALTPLYTPVWGYGQWNMAGGDLGAFFGRPVATYPAMSFKATPGKPVKVKWINHATDWHLLCPYPQDPLQPCAIDRTLMGTKLQPGEVVGQFGSRMQPDNAMVVHLHGGEIPPDSDGFAELWIGNAASAAAPEYNLPAYAAGPGISSNLDPPFLLPPVPHGVPSDAAYQAGVLGYDYTNPAAAAKGTYQTGQLVRPVGDAIFYNYPMVQRAATIWYHDHALGKTRINVAAGPAGYFYVEDAALEAQLGLPPKGDCSNLGIVGKKCFDIPIVLQDRSFNTNGSINFPNGLGQAQLPVPVGMPQPTPLAPGPNPDVHPQWVPEYFGDMAVVNGTIWPKLAVEPRPYRFRFLDGSNARCYTLGMKIPASLVPPPIFQHVASDQGFLAAVVPTNKFSICPGERAEVVIDFSAFANTQIFLTNTAAAPFPNGVSPSSAKSPYAYLTNLVRFDVGPPLATPVAWSAAAYNAPPAGGLPPVQIAPLPTLGAMTRQMILNEVLSPVTLAPLRVQIDGKAFEDQVTETPKRGSVEVWKIVNTTVDAHPMHLHLVQFQVVSRQKFDTRAFAAVALPAAGGVVATDVTPYLKGNARPPDAIEMGWKDTAKSYPGEVLTLAARWDGAWKDTPTLVPNPDPTLPPLVDATVPYWEPPTSGPYVWHCHIVDHEDNEMMRPVLVLP